MYSTIRAESECALTVKTAQVAPLCCQFASRVTSSNQGGLEDLVQLEFSEEFSKYIFHGVVSPTA